VGVNYFFDETDFLIRQCDCRNSCIPVAIGAPSVLCPRTGLASQLGLTVGFVASVGSWLRSSTSLVCSTMARTAPFFASPWSRAGVAPTG